MPTRRRRARRNTGAFTPRKLPRQQRSRATFGALVEAAARLLAERGYEGATTRRIADRAGASVGTLYQYFPSRDALVTAVLERHVDEVLDGIGGLLRRLEAVPLERAVRRIVEKVLALHDDDPVLHSVLMKHLPRADRTALFAKIDRTLGSHFRAFFAHRSDVPPFDVDRAMFVLARACIPIIHAGEEGARGPDLRVQDLTTLVLGYLRAAGAPSRPVPDRETRTSGRVPP